MTMLQQVLVHNQEVLHRDDVPLLSVESFRTAILDSVQVGARIAAFFGLPDEQDSIRIHAVLAHDQDSLLEMLSTRVSERYPSLTPECAQAHWFERELAEQWGIHPEDHPWLKPIRFHEPYRRNASAEPAKTIEPGVTDYFQVAGAEVHEVAVGPIHAGVIEPGHFRFQCHGEKVYHLEISLGYQHRGVERALIGGPLKRTLHLMETLAGDTTIGHATAYCQAVEALTGARPSLRAEVIRAIALELERLANHTGDLGALAGDVGFLPTMAFCGRLRGDFLNATAMICGNRFGRSLVRTGGVGFDIDAHQAAEMDKRLAAAHKDVAGAVALLWNTPSVMARFEETGTVSRQAALDIGLVGPAGRACGLDRDVRRDFPSGIFRFAQIPTANCASGDVFARAFIRWLEIDRSIAFIRRKLAHLTESGPSRVEVGALNPNRFVVSLVEGWRGEICHVALTDENGRFAHYKIFDPSFHNWFGLALALRGQQISDFPLCNKSFNLSYCGHDL